MRPKTSPEPFNLDLFEDRGTCWIITIRNSIRDMFDRTGHWPGRIDILSDSEGHHVYPGKDGSIVGDLKHFSDEDLIWAREESARCWKEALTEPGFMEVIMRYL